MLQNLEVINIPAPLNQDFYIERSSNVFVLKTCQRTLLIGPKESFFHFNHEGEKINGEQAYIYLLEIICGLKSRLVGENEIVNQFKLSYQDFMNQETRHSGIVKLLEKLFQDAKDIRSKYLIGISQKSYASIARRTLIRDHRAQEVLILGSGILAEDMINQLKKKSKVFISGRNTDKVRLLSLKHEIEIVDWKTKSLFTNFHHIVNSIGCENKIFTEAFFYQWFKNTADNRLFIDLGSPSAIETSFTKDQAVLRLNDIFEEGAVKDEQKLEKIREARIYIEGVVEKRRHLFLSTSRPGLPLVKTI